MDNLEQIIKETFTNEYNIELDMQDDLNENGISSIMFTQFLVKLEQKLGIEIPDELMDVYQQNTLESVVKLIREQMSVQSEEENL